MRAHNKQTEAGDIVEIYGIATRMRSAGLAENFIVQAVHLAEAYEGARDLFHLWDEETEQSERDEIVADLQEEIDDHAELSRGRIKKKDITGEDIDSLVKRIAQFKRQLRLKVDKWGGVSKLAEATRIPQPSLSRFFNSGSLPRRATLFKIGEALGLKDEEVLFDFE